MRAHVCGRAIERSVDATSEASARIRFTHYLQDMHDVVVVSSEIEVIRS